MDLDRAVVEYKLASVFLPGGVSAAYLFSTVPSS